MHEVTYNNIIYIGPSVIVDFGTVIQTSKVV